MYARLVSGVVTKRFYDGFGLSPIKLSNLSNINLAASFAFKISNKQSDEECQSLPMSPVRQKCNSDFVTRRKSLEPKKPEVVQCAHCHIMSSNLIL